MASFFNSPPFSAPATLERPKKWSNWLINARQAFMRPWRLRSQRFRRRARRVPDQQGPYSLTNIEPQFEDYSRVNGFREQGFPNFSNRLSPLGTPQSKGMSGDDAVEVSEINIPENPVPSRPPLSNIFPMFNNTSNVNNSSKVAIPPTSSIQNALQQRRHSTPIMPQTTPTYADRRASASSDTSVDKPRQGRRERRASVTRELPMLPKRGDDPLQTPPPINPPPQISPYSEYSGGPLAIDHSTPNQISMNFGPTHRPPVGPGGSSNNFTYPPIWAQPCQQLQELEEELEDDGEGDGEENVVDELEDWEHMKPVVMPTDHMIRETAPSKGLGNILRIMSSARKPDSAVSAGKQPKGRPLEEEEEEDIKGFDNFFLY